MIYWKLCGRVFFKMSWKYIGILMCLIECFIHWLIKTATLMSLCDDKMKTTCPKITEPFTLNPEYIFIFLTASVLTMSVCQQNNNLKEFEKAQKLAHWKTSDYFFPRCWNKRRIMQRWSSDPTYPKPHNLS